MEHSERMIKQGSFVTYDRGSFTQLLIIIVFKQLFI